MFDGAWLWEEYLNAIFEEKKLGITHAKNKTGDNGIQIYEGSNTYYPDFYKKAEGDNDGKKSFVLDAKYKRLGYGVQFDGEDDFNTNTVSICRDDLFQMITYMHVLPAKHCALLYPIEPKESQTQPVVLSKPRVLKGLGGEILGYGIRISAKEDMTGFWEEMKTVENDFGDKIRDFISLI